MINADKSHKCFGGTVGYYVHQSVETKTPMRFSLFLPPNVQGKIPYIIYLSGLTCTEDNFTTKAHAYQKAAELGIAILAPDTSPRGTDIPDDESYDLGQGAGFYVDATQSPWDKNFRMESYIIRELLPFVETEFGLDSARKSIMGHSMGGHGALIFYFRHPNLFRSCSAFAPIVHPTSVAWGQRALTSYLGNDENIWKQHDACELVATSLHAKTNMPILIDQGTADQFLEKNLKPHLFKDACEKAGQSLTLRMHDGYDHSYFFIQSFINDHLEWHAKYF
jgi:S-formylglutathione hydrolase